jgi:hypothetical protein
MKDQIDTRELPTKNPPNAESESPGAVGTATGADIQRVLQKTDESYRKPNVNIKATADLHVEHSAFSERRKPDVRREHPVILFEAALREAIVALRRDVGDIETPDPHQNVTKTEAATPTSDMVRPPVAVWASTEYGVAS